MVLRSSNLLKKIIRKQEEKRSLMRVENKIVQHYLNFEEDEFCKIYPNEFFGYTKVTIEQPKVENGKVVTDRQGNPKPDTKKRDYERIPLSEDIEEYFQREVKPHLPDLPAPLPNSDEYCTYVLKCSDGSFYKGQTKDIHRRLEEHHKGHVSWTSQNLPIKLIHWEVFDTREKAVKREHYLKTGKGREWLKKHYEEGKLKSMERWQAGSWMDRSKDKVGYEINFTKYFYQYKPLRSLEEISQDLLRLDKETEGLMKEILV